MSNVKQPDFSDLAKLTEQLNGETERGLVMISLAYIDSLLIELLQAFMIEGRSTEKLLKDVYGPFGTFSARCDSCFALGLLDPKELKILKILGTIRNKFAHQWQQLSLKDQMVSELITKLPSTGDVKTDTHDRLHFSMTAAQMIVRLKWRGSEILKNNSKRVELSHLPFQPWVEGDSSLIE